MINALISLNADLASSIAFRYACRLKDYIDMRLQPIHVEEVDEVPPGSGWVRSTWEKGLVQTAREEIAQLINAEKADCALLDATIVRTGEYDEVLLHEIENRSSDLLLEGVLSSFRDQLFHKRIRSKLHRFCPAPIIVVKNLVQPDKVGLLLGESPDVTAVVPTFLKLFTEPGIRVDLIYFAFKKRGKPAFREKVSEGDVPTGTENAVNLLNSANEMLAEKGWRPKEMWAIQDSPERIGAFLCDYGLVGAALTRNIHKEGHMLELLSQISTATLLCKK